jgi:threonine/homoserine/homoserine lactone efflux protein
LSNPKTALVFGSAFAAFLPKDVPDYTSYLVSASAFLIDTAWYSLVAILLSTEKAQYTYMKFKKYICRAAGGFMGIMGVKLLTNQ